MERKKTVFFHTQTCATFFTIFDGAPTHVHFIAEEEIAEFEISMNDFVVVQILDAQRDLLHEISRLGLRNRLAPLVQFHERAASTELEQNVDVLAVLEEAEELDDVVVLERLVNGDFLSHLFFGMLFLE